MNVSDANGVEIAWESFGREEDETVLLISGLGAQMIRWTDPFCEGLAARGFRVVRFDNRDAGLSSHFAGAPAPDFAALAAALPSGRTPETAYSLNDMARDAVALLDALSVRRAHVVGRSMGGMIAQILASDHPERVRSLCSIMSSTGNPSLPQAAPDVHAMMTGPGPDPKVDPEGLLSRSLAFARRIAGSAFAFDEAEHRAIILEELRRAHDPAGAARQLAAMALAGDRRARLATIGAPTLVLHGTEDPLIPAACGEDTVRAIPGAAYLPIEGMGHDLPAVIHDRVTDALELLARRSGS